MEYPYIPRRVHDTGVHIVDRSFIISADLGQAFDYTAISIIERIIKGRGVMGPDRNGERMLYLRHIERPVRGTEYPVIVDRLAELYRARRLQTSPKPS